MVMIVKYLPYFAADSTCDITIDLGMRLFTTEICISYKAAQTELYCTAIMYFEI